MSKQDSAIGRKGQKGRLRKHAPAFRRMVARHYLDGDQSMRAVSDLYGISSKHVCQWSKEFSSELSEEESQAIMTEQEQKDFEALKKQNEILKKKLDYEQMRTFALETMIDLAKEKLGVDVRKNFGAKQPEE